MMDREQITPYAFNCARVEIDFALTKTLEKKGFGSFASRHEALGAISEEFRELEETVRTGDMQRVKEELIDLALVSEFAVACIVQDSLEW